MVSRRRRFIRLRSTALPKALGVVKPTLGPSEGLGFCQQKATKHELGTLKPWSYTFRKSALFRMRRDFGKVSRGWAEVPGLGVGVADGAFVTDGKFMTATGAAAGKNGAAVLRFHTRTEAVLLRTLVVVRLKGSFRHAASLGWPGASKSRKGTKMALALAGRTVSIGGRGEGVKPGVRVAREPKPVAPPPWRQCASRRGTCGSPSRSPPRRCGAS